MKPTFDGGAGSWHLRGPERGLLIGSMLAVSLGFLMALGSAHAAGRGLTALDLLPLITYGASLAAVHLTLVLSGFRGDQILPAAAAFLSGIGLVIQYRLGAFDSPDPWASARIVLPAAVLAMLAVCVAGMRGRYRLLAARPWLFGGLSLVLVVLVLVTGQRFRGGVYAAGLVTPTEALKVTVVVFLAGWIDREAKALGRWRGLLPPLQALAPLLGFWALLSGLLFLQRDLGMLVILGSLLLVLLSTGTGRLGYLVYGLLAATGLGYLVLAVFTHGRRRIQAWQEPFADPTGDGWQILQGLSGMYSGGLWGEGFGRGNPEYTPIAASDFVYSVIGEELGFLGCAAILLFFLLLFGRGLTVADRARSSFGMLLCAGLTTALATQTFLNIGGVTKFIPLTGVTLPFISQGGSSLMVAFVGLGLMLAVSDGEAPRQRAGPAKDRPGGTKASSSRQPDPGPTRSRAGNTPARVASAHATAGRTRGSSTAAGK